MAATPRSARKVGKCGRLKADLRVCRRRGARITAKRPGSCLRPPPGGGRSAAVERRRPRKRARARGNIGRSRCQGGRAWAGAVDLRRCSGATAPSARVSHGLPRGKERKFFAITAGRARYFSRHPALTLALFCRAAALRGLRGGAGVWARVRSSCPARRRPTEIVTEVGLGHRSAAMAREAGRMAHP
jgi:hypothetical protein